MTATSDPLLNAGCTLLHRVRAMTSLRTILLAFLLLSVGVPAAGQEPAECTWSVPTASSDAEGSAPSCATDISTGPTRTGRVAETSASLEADPFHPVSTFVLTREAIERIAPTSLPDLLEGQIPGVYSLSVGADDDLHRTIRIRGPGTFPACSTCRPKLLVKVLVDGVEVNPIALGSFPVHDVERVEVIRGPHASLLYGPDASSGVILLYTRKSSAEAGHHVEGRAAIGVRGSPYVEENPLDRSYRAGISGRFESVGYTLGFDRHVSGGHVPAYGWHSNGAAFGFVADLAALRVSGTSRLTERHIARPGRAATLYHLYLDGLLPILSRRIDQDDYADYRNLMVGLTFDYRPSDRWRTTLVLGDDVVEVDERILPTLAPGDSLIRVQTERASLPSVRLRSALALELSGQTDLAVAVGADARRSRLNRSESVRQFLDQPRVPHWRGELWEEHYGSAGGSAEAALRLANRFSLSGGVRADWHSYFGPDYGEWSLNPRAGISYRLSPFEAWSLEVRAAWARGIGAPTRGMLTGEHPTVAPNPAIGPQTTSGWDLGVSVAGFSGRLGADATLYSQVTRGALGPTSPAPGQDRGQHVNFEGQILSQGGEVAFWWLGAATELRASLAMLSNEVRHATPFHPVEPMPDDPMPESVLWGEARQSLERWVGLEVWLGARATYVGRRWAPDTRAIYTAGMTGIPPEATHRFFEGFTRAGLMVEAKLSDGIDIRFDLLNLTDSLEQETPEFVVPGREMRFSVTARR